MAAAPRYPISDHCDGIHFFNPRAHVNRTWLDVIKWRRTSTAQPWPRQVEVAPRKTPLPERTAKAACTWINHATFLLQYPDINVLTDPVYSDCAGPFGRLGPRRVHLPGIAFPDLPRIDLILLSHDHYDHCDLPTLRRLATAHDPVVITPLGNAPLLRRAGFAASRIIELDWWQQTRRGELDITLTPARHWSNRLSGSRNGRLWGGFYLQGSGQRIAFTGDTGYDPVFFRDIGRRLGSPNLALIPIGAYEPRWFMAPQHCNPEEALQIHTDLGAQRSIGMHWGTFQLTDEGRDEPVLALKAALAAQKLPAAHFTVLQPGETVMA